MQNKLILALAGAALLGSAAAASAADGPSKRRALGAADLSPAAVVAQGQARAEALINADGSIARSKGVVSATNIGGGEYCVTLKTSISAATAVPTLSFNYISSADYDVFVTYDPNLACPTNSIGVVTYQADAGGHVFANEGFTIVVP